MEIRISGIDKLAARLNDLAKNKLPYACSKAVNDTVYNATQDLGREIKDSFDRPTPMIQKAVLYEKAGKEKLSAKIYLKDQAVPILRPHISGGSRIVKASEARLRRSGLMGGGQWLVPGPGIALDSYGNIPATAMKKILSQLDTFKELGYNKMSRKAARRGIGTIYCIPFVGVFKHTGPKTSVPLLFFTYNRPKYEQRFDFYGTIRQSFKKNFSKNFAQAWRYALRDAKWTF